MTAVFYFQDFIFKEIYSKLGHQVPKFVIYNYAVLGLATQLCPALCDPIDYRPPGSSFPWGFSMEWVAIPPPGDLPHPQIEPRSPALQSDFLLSEPPGKTYTRYTIIVEKQEYKV